MLRSITYFGMRSSLVGVESRGVQGTAGPSSYKDWRGSADAAQARIQPVAQLRIVGDGVVLNNDPGPERFTARHEPFDAVLERARELGRRQLDDDLFFAHRREHLLVAHQAAHSKHVPVTHPGVTHRGEAVEAALQ